MKIIGVSGQMQMGKDTLADYLYEELNKKGYNFKRLAFAFAVKKVFMDVFGKDWDFIEEWKVKNECPEGFNKNVRQALQFIGDGFRTIKYDIWIDLAFRKNYDAIVSDCRYINELERIKKENGFNILVYRPGYENDDPNGSESQIRSVIDYFKDNVEEGIVKESKYNFINCFIINNGTVYDLYKKVDNIIIPYLGKYYD